MGAAVILNEFEIRCITNDFENYCFDLKSDSQVTEPITIQLMNFVCGCIVKSNYDTLLKKSFTDYGFSPSTIDLKDPKVTLCNLLTDKTDDDLTRLIKEFILLFIGVAALQEFVRCNFCGPRDDVMEHYLLISELLPDFIATDSDISHALSLDGESISSNVIHPKLLYVSHFLLSNVQNASSFTGKWWLLRCKFLHQQLLHEKNESLHSAVVSLVKDVYQMDWISKAENVSKKLIFAVESCHIFLFYGEIVIARQYITDAQIITGLEIELSGAIGKRTKYQQKPVAQLYVKLKRNNLNFTVTMPKQNECLPVNLNLQDDTLLNKVAFIDNDHIFDSLYAEEQIVLLGYSCLMKRSGSFDKLLQEELMSYINCLLSQPQIWAIYLKALIMRCNTEKNSRRRLERSVMQMETVVKSIKMALPLFSQREKFFYSTSFPTYWMLEKELADLLLSIGCTKSALDIYERLELWEDIVICYIHLQRTSSAEKVINDQIAKGETPVLWCMLGDVTKNPEHYLKAWELSNHRSARAQRSLGYHLYNRKEYEKCIPAFRMSLNINHLQPQVWLFVGHSAMQVEKFDLASQAYRHVVMFDDDNFEAWNNLAVAFMKTKQKVCTWRSLNEALKCNYGEWRVWENFLLVSTDVGAFEDALRAWHRLLDIKQGRHHDSNSLNKLVSAILKDVPDIKDVPASRLRKRAMELLGRITSVITNDPKIWELYAALANSEDVIKKDSIEKVVQYQKKAVWCYNQKGQWERNFSSCKEVLLCSLKLAEVSLAFIKLLEKGVVLNQQKTSAKLGLQNVMARAKKFLHDFSDCEKDELHGLLKNLDNTVNVILSL